MASSKYYMIPSLLKSLGTLHSYFFHIFHNSCVFGSVVEGMDVVQAIESVGSNSGQTKAPVMVAASGQL